jgi:hypothetical protein
VTVFTVRATVVVWLSEPEVPVIVTVDIPVVAVLLAVSVKVLVAVVGFVPNDAVTPFGRPDAARVTLPIKPFWAATLIVLDPLDPWVMVRLLGDAERLKSDVAVEFTVRASAVVWLSMPEVPVIVTVDVPVVAALLAVSVKVLVDVVGFVPNDAVTPAGRPDAARVTLPVKLFWGATVMVVELLDPWVMVRLLDDAERLKSGVPPLGCVETVPQLAGNQLKSNATTRPGLDRPRRRPSFHPDLIKPLPNT